MATKDKKKEKLTKEAVEQLLKKATPGVRELGENLRHVFATPDWRKRLR